MFSHLKLRDLAQVISSLRALHNEELRAHPSREWRPGESIDEVPKVKEAKARCDKIFEQIGYAATAELVALMYLGRDRSGDFLSNLEMVHTKFRDIDQTASKLTTKSSSVEFITIGLALTFGMN